MGGWKARYDFCRTRQEDGLPTQLPPSAARGVAAGRAGDLILPLPMDVATLHSRQRGEAASTLRKRAADWLSSEAGQEWKKERALLFGEGGLSPDAQSIPSDSEGGVTPGKKPRLL